MNCHIILRVMDILLYSTQGFVILSELFVIYRSIMYGNLQLVNICYIVVIVKRF